MADASSITQEFLDAWNRRDWTRYRDMLDPQYSYTGGDGRRQDGPEAGLAAGQMFATAFPDGVAEIRQIHRAGENLAVAEFTGRGTHSGDFMGIAPTGREVTIPVCDVVEVRNGKIIAEREYIDLLHLLQQIGAAPVPAMA